MGQTKHNTGPNVAWVPVRDLRRKCFQSTKTFSVAFLFQCLKLKKKDKIALHIYTHPF